MHSTNDLDDGYMGSGKRLRYSIRKYGKENHTKEILEFFDSRDLLIEAEIKAITPEMITDKDCMNLKEGGDGGSDFKHVNDKGLNNKANQCVLGGNVHAKKLKEDEDYAKWHSEKSSKIMKEYLASGVHNHNTFEGKKHTEETKKKMSKTSKGMGKGKNNSQYGTCWVRKSKHGEEKKIKKEELNKYLSEGWERGRTLPELVCGVGQKLRVRKDIPLDALCHTVYIGEICMVKDIKGYGFDVVTVEEPIMEIRLLNSQMLDYFELI
jgi:hypothetical protein